MAIADAIAMDSIERQVLADLIASVRTLAKHTLTLHLQLGAVRTLLVRKGTMSETELRAAVAELGAVASLDELINPEAPSPDAIFEELLQRLEESP
jgi:hypothetical protein